MANDQEHGPASVTHTREVTIDALCEHFANDIMSVEEFELRIDRAHQASTSAELRELLRDLPGGDLVAPSQNQVAPALKQQYTVTSAAQVKDRGFAVAIMGGTARKGRWTPARNNYAIAVMGSAQLDFRDASGGHRRKGVYHVRRG